MPVIVWSDWAPLATYRAGDYVAAAPGTGFLYQAKVGGVSAPAAPAFPTTLLQTVVDSAVTWLCFELAPYITRQDLEDRLTRKIVKLIFDDNEDGAPDLKPVNRLLFDATSFVAGLIEGQYPLTAFPAGSALPNELVRITLDVASAMCALRHPRIVRVDGKAMLATAREELKELKSGVSRMDLTPGTATAVKPGNIGGRLYDGSVRMIIDDANGRSNNGLL